MAFCPRCAAPNIDSAAACAACGAPLSAASGVIGGAPQPGGQPAGINPQISGGEFAPRMNGLAVAGFVCSFFCAIVGLPMSIVAYDQCKKSNGALKGEGLALAGIIIGAIMLGLTVINFVVNVTMK